MLCSFHREALSIIDDFRLCVSEMVAEGTLVGVNPTVELLDPSVAMIFAKSTRANVSSNERLHCLPQDW